MILVYIMTAVFIAVQAVCVYLFVRNGNVAQFRNRMIQRTPDSNFYEAVRLWNKYTYEDMLYSLKPLKLEAWFTEEEIKILTGKSDGED